jgi:diazepam-binding inhibitor (GABA receptor modulator, acyl-CoA-binding protein)
LSCGLQEDFDVAAEEAKSLPDNTSNEDKLQLYALFKQATVGDVNTDRPGIFDPKVSSCSGLAQVDCFSFG